MESNGLSPRNQGPTKRTTAQSFGVSPRELRKAIRGGRRIVLLDGRLQSAVR